jgi:Protein of unknown function (DUF3300)
MNRTVLRYAAALSIASVSVWAQAPPQYPDSQPGPGYQQPPAGGYQQPPPGGYQQPPPAGQQPPPDAPRLSPQELGNLVAPIALYPDLLLSEVLAASTYPLELTQAQQWMQQNPGLHGPQLVDAAKQQNWDPSVQALVAFPDVMNLLTRDIQWTTDLGNAFLAQQADVMDSIQRLRASARDNGRLTNTPQQRVTYEQENGQSAIVIQPTDPQVVYAPVYNPAYVWGPPVYGVYPPLAYPAPGYGIYFGVGAFLGGLFTGLLSFGGWGWGLSWLTHGLFLNGLFFSHFGFHGYGGYGFHPGGSYVTRAPWVHDPGHRLGVPYGNRFAGARYAGRSFNTGRSAYAGSAGYHSGYEGGGRQMEAYRGLTARGGAANPARGGASGFQSRYASPAGNSYRAGNGYKSGFEGGANRAESARSSGGSFSSSRYSAPKSSSHFDGGGGGRGHSNGGGGHGHSSGGGGHSHSGGGHSHGGGHKK